jgi:hypothetical protein
VWGKQSGGEDGNARGVEKTMRYTEGAPGDGWQVRWAVHFRISNRAQPIRNQFTERKRFKQMRKFLY